MTGRNVVLDSRAAAARDRHARIVDALVDALRARPRRAHDLAELVARQQASIVQAQAELGELLDDLRVDAAWTGESGLDWAEECGRLVDVFAKDPRAGLVSWLQLVVGSLLFDQRVPAELLDAALPSYADVLVDRVRRLDQGLANHAWDDCALLRRFADDPALGQALEFGDPERGQLATLVARLALSTGRLDDAGDWLQRAAVLGAPADQVALAEAARQRLSGDAEAAAAALQEARDLDASDVGVLIEDAQQAATAADPGAQIDAGAVEAEIWSLPSVAAAHDELERMVEPVLPEVWVALARRHLAEADLTRAAASLERARGAAAADARPTTTLQGLIGELNLVLLETRGTAPDELSAAAVGTAGLYVDVGQHDRAIDLLNHALGWTPGYAPALVYKAESMRLRALSANTADASEQLAQVLAMLDPVPLSTGTDDLTWVLNVRSAAEKPLADRLDPDCWLHSWQALDAGAWAVAFGPANAFRWGQLASVSQEVGLYQLSRLAATTAVLMPGAVNRVDTAVNLAIVLANQGDLVGAHELTAEAEPDGFVHILVGAALGDVAGLVDRFVPRAVTSDLVPLEWYWLLLGQLALDDPRVSGFADLALAQAVRDLGSVRWREAHVLALLALDRWADADRQARPLTEISRANRVDGTSSHVVAAVAAYLAGEGDDTAIASALARVTSRAEPELWATMLRPCLVRLADRARRPFADDTLVQFEAHLAARVHELGRRTLEDDLADDSFDRRWPDAARRARAVAAAVCQLRAGNTAAVFDARIEHPPPAPRSDGDGAILAREALAAAPRLRAVELAESLTSADPSAVEPLVRDLLRADQRDADVYLNAARLSAVQRDAIGAVLFRIAAGRTDEDASAARFALRYLGWPAFPPPDAPGSDDAATDEASTFVVELPSSRFAEVDDPLRADDLFVDVIPTVRRFQPLPVLTVRASDELEPDGYRILRSDAVVEQGTTPASARWLNGAADSLDVWPREQGGAAESPWVAVRPDPSDPLGDTCTASTDEMVVRRASQLSQVSAPPPAGLLAKIDDLAGSVKGWWQRVRPQA